MLYLPKGFPAVEILTRDGAEIAVYDVKKANVAATFPIGTLRILFLNLMPQKAVTELDMARMMVGLSGDIALLPMKIAGQTYKTTPASHMNAFYTDFEDFATGCYDGLIITGAPVEHLAFEDVRYWQQLCQIMDWAEHNTTSTLYVCWGAQAGLYHYYGIPKYSLPAKMFGIFPQRVLDVSSPVLKGLPSPFPMPNSRHTEVRRGDIERAGLSIVAESSESGVGVVSSPDGRRVFIVGHLEYGAETLQNEYLRDCAKGLPILPPRHYYDDEENPSAGIDFSWQTAARQFYANWLKICRLE